MYIKLKMFKLSTVTLLVLSLSGISGTAYSVDLGGLFKSIFPGVAQPTPNVLQESVAQPTPNVLQESVAQPTPNVLQEGLKYQASEQKKSNEIQLSEIKVVEVEGIGENKQKAKEDAYRNAVEKAVGSFVSADLIAKNNQLIKDDVLNFSAGYIEKSEVMSEGQRPDGLYSIKLRASVANKKLSRQLEKLSIATADVDSESLFAEAITISNQRDSAQKLWVKLFDDFWSKAFKVEVSGKPEVVYGLDDNVQAYFKVVVRFNEQFLNELENTMRGTGSSLRSGKIPFHFDSYRTDSNRTDSICLVKRAVSPPNTTPSYSSYSYNRPRQLVYVDNPRFYLPFDQKFGPNNTWSGDDDYSLGEGYCVDIPIRLDSWSNSWKPPIKMRGGFNGTYFYRTFSPYFGSAYPLTLDAFQKLEIPHILLTLQNKAGENLASAGGILVGNNSVTGLAFGAQTQFISGAHPRNLIFIGDRVDVRYISVKLKRNQLQDISKVDVRTVGKLIYAGPRDVTLGINSRANEQVN